MEQPRLLRMCVMDRLRTNLSLSGGNGSRRFGGADVDGVSPSADGGGGANMILRVISQSIFGRNKTA